MSQSRSILLKKSATWVIPTKTEYSEKDSPIIRAETNAAAHLVNAREEPKPATKDGLSYRQNAASAGTKTPQETQQEEENTEPAQDAQNAKTA